VPEFFRAKDTFPLLFGFVWLGISVMLTFYGKHMADWLTTEPKLNPFGIPFVLIGAAMMTTPIWNYRRERGTLYVITNKRAIIAIKHGRTVTMSFWPDQLQKIRILDHSNGTTSIVFSKRVVSQDDDFNLVYEDVGFLKIADHKKAFQLLGKLALAQGECRNQRFPANLRAMVV
jgi:hypothetical protein